MIRFLYHAQSTATREKLTTSIREDLAAGQKAILLVPEQETVSTERRMLELLPPAAQLSFEVLNFSRLANRVFRVLGGLSYHAASPAVSALFMWQALGELAPCLRQYSATAAKDNALCELMLRTAAQCKAACISPDDLLQAADALPDGEPLKEKLGDIGLILSTYEQRLGEKFDNAADDLSRLADLLTHQGGALFSETHIYIDSFTDFTVQELAVLRALLAVAPTVTVTFPLPHRRVEHGLHLTSVLHTHRQLLSMAKELGRRVYDDSEGDSRPKTVPEFLSWHLFDMEAEKAPLALAESGQLSLCVCTSPFEEATAVATQIHRLVREGCRYRDIAVVVRDASVWNGILDAELEKEDIPFFISEKTDITLCPLIKLILEALRIRLGNWRTDDVVGYLKTGLCGIESNDINLFEEYVNVWKLRGEKAYTGGVFSKNPDGCRSRISERGRRILEGANRVREAMLPPLLAFFSALDNAQSATEMCRALYEFLNILDIREKLKNQAKDRILAGERREAEELSKLYNVTVDALEDISHAMGSRKLTVSEFADTLKLVFGRTDIGTIPTSADEVTIGSASMLRTDHPRFVLVVGLNDGLFPATVSESGLLGEAERQRLKELGVDFPSGSEKLASDELFYIHRAFSAPREGLYLSYSTSGTDGRSLSPSIAIARIKALFPDIKAIPFTAGDPLNRIFTPSAALEALTGLPKDAAAAISSLLKEKDLHILKTLSVPVVNKQAAVTSGTAHRLFARGKFNPTHLEGFAACQFKYYCDKILRLREEADGSLSSAETGTFIHYVLEHTMETVQREKLPFSAYDAARQKEIVAHVTARYRSELIELGGELTPRAEALLARLKELAQLIVSGLFSEFSDSLFSPVFLEFNLSSLEAAPTVTLPNGEPIPLSGQIDRVDYWQDEAGTVYLRVADYKTGSKSFEVEDIQKGFCLQMPLYLLSLCRSDHSSVCRALGLPESTAVLPAGVTYLSSNISVENTESRKSADAAMADAVKRLVREGLLHADPRVRNAMSVSGDKSIIGGAPRDKSKTLLGTEEFEALFDTLERSIASIAQSMRSGSAEIKANPQGKSSPCDYCPYTPICRAAKKSKE